MRYDPIDPQLFVRNRDKLRALLQPNSIVIVLANDIFPTNADGTMAFKQNADLFYLTGVDQEETVLVLMPELVTRGWRRLLHNQKALYVKRLLLFEPGVVLAAVPYQLLR